MPRTASLSYKTIKQRNDSGKNSGHQTRASVSTPVELQCNTFAKDKYVIMLTAIGKNMRDASHAKSFLHRFAFEY